MHPAPFAAFIGVLLALPALAQETRPFVDDLGREVEVPASPERIVALHDSMLTLPLIELGIMPVATATRTAEDGTFYIRSGVEAFGVDLESSGIVPVGGRPVDYEAIASAAPDLIVTTEWQGADLDRLSRIAPTVLIEQEAATIQEIYERLAALTGTEDRHAQLQRRYEANIARLAAAMEGHDVCASMIQVFDGEIDARDDRGNFDRVMEAVGVSRPPIFEQLAPGERRRFSMELLPEFDCDLLFSFYWGNEGMTPADGWAHWDANAFPGWCDTLHACREGQIYVFSISDMAIGTYDALHAMTTALNLVLVGGNEIVPFEGR
ncbi:MAG: ABC transporter substrate-binding protein [Pseudomonadota bacterium]